MVPVTEKRKQRTDERVGSPTVESKRPKVETSVDIPAGEQEDQKKVGATELASAFALASLAALSPSSSKSEEAAPETRDVEHGEEGSTASWEVGSPRTEPVPISPEGSTLTRSCKSRRVTFAPGIKDTTRLGSRTQSFPPRINHGQASRMPPGFARVSVPLKTQMPPPSRVQMPPPHWGRKHHSVFQGQPNFFPPYASPSPPASDQWVCDFCNVAAFPTYQEACAHEGACRARFSMNQISPGHSGPWSTSSHGPRPVVPHFGSQGMVPPATRGLSSVYSKMPLPGVAAAISMDYSDQYGPPPKWFEGSVSLSIPESDPEWLSGMNCYIRQFCVEAFSASSEDANKTTKRGRIALHQVGIRCCFCKLRPVEDRQAGAVSYPLSLAGIYESVKRWQRVHLMLCEDAPESVRKKLNLLNTDNSWIPTTRQYWTDSAKSLGMVDTPDGIRFAVDPNVRRQNTALMESRSSHGEVMHRSQYPLAKRTEPTGSLQEGEPIVFPEDTNMVPSYVYFLIRQVESCRFTEADRFVARSKGPVGYPGFQCKHCNGHAGLGKYFPVSSKSLATNSTSQNIHAHLLKCRKCPAHIKEQLLTLKEEKSKAPRLEPGWRKVFFEKIWARLHG